MNSARDCPKKIIENQMDASTIRCLITAGPTREYLDPVRYISNGSSGKMGYALAAAARDRGWAVDLVSGPVALEPPEGVEVHRVISGEEMFRKTEELFDRAQIVIFCAAVSDFRPVQVEKSKSKKPDGRFLLEMEPVVDIAKTLGGRKKAGQLLVGFAAETDALEEKAKGKLEAKNFDWIVANEVGGENSAMEGDENTITMISRFDEIDRLGPALKTEVAQFILEKLELKKGR